MEKNMNDMKSKMDENKEEIQKYMSSIILQALDERLPKGDMKMLGTHENKGSITTILQPTRLTPQQTDEIRAKGLCFNYDKYNKGNKCGEKKLFYIDCEEE
jgi:hypothetical protein